MKRAAVVAAVLFALASRAFAQTSDTKTVQDERPIATDCRTADPQGGYIVVAFATVEGATVYLRSLVPSQQDSAYLLPVKGNHQYPKFLVVVSTCDYAPPVVNESKSDRKR
jgi:hypothetical protein